MVAMSIHHDDAKDDYPDDDQIESIELAALTKPPPLVETSSIPYSDVCRARRLLYVSHALAQFSEIAWQFSLALFLAASTNYQSMALVSSYNMCVCGAVAMGSPVLGRWMDRHSHQRLTVARILIVSENVAVVIATVFCFLLLSNATEVSSSTVAPVADDHLSSWWAERFRNVPTDPKSLLALIMIHFLGAMAQVFDQAFLVAMERDWVVELSRAAATTCRQPNNNNANFRAWLSDTNVAMKQIDLSAKVVAPALIGLLFAPTSTHATSLQWACAVVGGLNVVALVVEYWCTAAVYGLVPTLHNKSSGNVDEHTTTDPATASPTGICAELVLYFRQPIAWAGVALALLYSNALTFGNGILTTYLLYRNVKLPIVGVLRGTASVIGLLGACVYHMAVRRWSLETTGMGSIAYQFACLGLSFLSLFVEDRWVSLVMLIVGVCLSRIGLWVFDIAVTQMQQEEIPDGIRGRVGGVQQGLNSLCNLLSFVAGFLYPDPKDFFVFVAAGFSGVAIALLSYAAGVYFPRSVRR